MKNLLYAVCYACKHVHVFVGVHDYSRYMTLHGVHVLIRYIYLRCIMVVKHDFIDLDLLSTIGQLDLRPNTSILSTLRM